MSKRETKAPGTKTKNSLRISLRKLRDELTSHCYTKRQSLPLQEHDERKLINDFVELSQVAYVHVVNTIIY
jgi:hypothetical protein